MKCNNCGNEFEESLRNCPKCGSKNPNYVKPERVINPYKLKQVEKNTTTAVKTDNEETKYDQIKNKSSKTKKCPYCAEEILIDAKKCKHCGEMLDKQVSQTISNEVNEAAAVSDNTKKNVSPGCAGIVIAAALLFFLVPMMCNRNDKPKQTGLDKAMIMAYAEHIVETRLKAPSTAKFSWPSEWNMVEIDKQHIRISSYVDSQNSYGAMLRNHFTVTLKSTDNNDWTLENIKFD
jgi:predicted  nucleic acid-binding Zn-ribbon protein